MYAAYKVKWKKEDRKLVKNYFGFDTLIAVDNKGDFNIDIFSFHKFKNYDDLEEFIRKMVKKYIKADPIFDLLKSDYIRGSFDTYEKDYLEFQSKLENEKFKEMFDIVSNLRKLGKPNSVIERVANKLPWDQRVFRTYEFDRYKIAYNLYHLFECEEFIKSEDYVDYLKMKKEVIKEQYIDREILPYFRKLGINFHEVDEDIYLATNNDYVNTKANIGKTHERVDTVINWCLNKIKNNPMENIRQRWIDEGVTTEFLDIPEEVLEAFHRIEFEEIPNNV